MRQFFQLFEIDLLINDTSVDWSSDPTSYNTPKTTLDPNACVGEYKTYRWCNQVIQGGINAFPSLESLTSNPPKIEPGKTIGLRATGSVTLGDLVTTDAFELPENMQDRSVTGSSNKKLLARNYLINRPCRVITGVDPKNITNALVENYYISNVTPAKNGSLRIDFVDPLYFTTEEKAKAPRKSNATLANDITDSQTVFSIIDTDGEYTLGDTGYIRQSSEIYSYEVTDTNELTVVREQAGTAAQSHSAGDTVQKCLAYQNVNIIDIFTDIFTNYTNIDNSFIPTSKWAALKTGDLADFNLTNFIGEPTEVREILNQLIEISGVSMFFDVELQEITIISTPRFTEPAATFTDELNIKQDSCSVKPSFKNKITRQAINWGKVDYSQGNDDQYYANGFEIIDGTEEDDCHAGQEFAAETINSDWLETNSAEDAQLATRVPQLNVSRFSKTPNTVEFITDRDYIGGSGDSRVWLGSVIQLETEQYLGADLQRVPLLAQITGVTPRSMNEFLIQGLSYQGNVLSNVDLYINASTQDYILSDILNPVEVREYIVVINTGVDIGATSTANYSFDTGAFPVGASLKIINLGRTLGAGGNGADPVERPGSVDGHGGGIAINLQVDTIIDNLSGFIAGGGGGGAAAHNGNPALMIYGGGGGGGQGFIFGSGGVNVENTDFSGLDGSLTYPGLGYVVTSPPDKSGANGGAFGEDGYDSADGVGGSAGLAIQTNGYTLSIISGNNSAQIKGGIV